MRIYPAVDLKDGYCVRLKQGSYQKITVYEKDPVQAARRWEALGAQALHLVDLDGARSGGRVNESTVIKILNSVEIPLQLGGGIRDTTAVETFLNLGVSHVIIGTAAVEKPDWVREMIQKHGSKIIVGVDAVRGFVATNGWESVSQIRALDYIKELEAWGLKRIVYTDVEKDGMLGGPNFKMYEALLGEVALEVIAAGGISALSDIIKLKSLGLYGAVVGKALYDGRLDLAEVLKC